MSNLPRDQILQIETTCGSLLYELQIIWDELGESDAERDRMLLELEQECLEVYRRKVDQTSCYRAQLRRAIADHEAELAAICSTMGERPLHLRQSEMNVGTLKEELKAIVPQLEEMRRKKSERLGQFREVVDQIEKISKEMLEPSEYNPSIMILDESDLSTRKLDELNRQLHALQAEKSDRIRKVLDHLNTLNSICLVLGLDFKQTVCEVHSSLDNFDESKNISNTTIENLATAIERLREIKRQRMQKLQDLATSMLELWNLMDTPPEEQQIFQNVTCKIAASEHEITESDILSLDFLNYVEAEVARLEGLKLSKIKEIVLKKRSELEDICRLTHMVAEADTTLQYTIEAIESGAIDPTCILEQMELQIAKVKEEAFSRKDILEKVDKWLIACEEEAWLEEYNRDENRYNAGKGAHLILKRAEKARATSSKLPAMVEALLSKTLAWEREQGVEFTYDGIRLLTMLDEYNILRQEKEEERKRKREEKKLQGQLMAEQEARFGSKPSPLKTPNAKKPSRPSTGNASRRLSLGGALIQAPKFDSHFPKSNNWSRSARKGDNYQDDGHSALSAGRRGLDIAGLPVKRHSFNPSNCCETDAILSRKHSFNPSNCCETDAILSRKPFSPVSALSFKANMTNDSNSLDGSAIKTTSINTHLATPTKMAPIIDEENRTPKVMGIPPPTTPFTVSVPMQTAITPAPPVSALFSSSEREIPDEVEYSFEERRFGFTVPNTCNKLIYA